MMHDTCLLNDTFTASKVIGDEENYDMLGTQHDVALNPNVLQPNSFVAHSVSQHNQTNYIE